MRISGFVDKCWSLCCSSGFQYILWHILEGHLGRPFNDMFCCTTIISLISSIYKTNILCDENSLSPKLCTRPSAPPCPSTSGCWCLLAGPCLHPACPLSRGETKGALRPQGQRPCPWSCQGSQRRGASVFLLKFFRHQLHPTTGGRAEGRSQESGKWRGLVSGWLLPSQKYEEMKTHQSRMPCHVSGSYLISSICFLLIEHQNRTSIVAFSF